MTASADYNGSDTATSANLRCGQVRVRTLRAACTVFICLWLVLPGTYAFALCFSHDGTVALEVAPGHGRGCSDSEHGRGQQLDRPVFTSHEIACHGDCTDLVLRGANEAIPPGGVSTKHAPEQRTEDVTQAAPYRVGSQLQTELTPRFLSLAPSPERPPAADFTVLRL